MSVVKYKSGSNWVTFAGGGSIATDSTYGYVKVATDEDVEEGTDNSAAVTAKQLKSRENNIVHKSGNETITGQKTFDLTVRLNQIQSTGTGTGDADPHINFVDMDGGPSLGGKGAYVAIEDGATGQWNKIATVQGNNTFTGQNTFNQTINGTAYRAQWGDLAEYYLTDKEYPKGTLVQFGGEKEITIATNKVNAVITSEPGFVLNNEQKDSQAIALIGRVPVRIIGKVKKFDKISLSYIDGVGCVNNDTETPMGIALQDKIEEDESLVLCSVKISLL